MQRRHQVGKPCRKDLAAALSNRGRAYYNKNDFDHAMADFDQAIATDPGTALLFYRRSALDYFRKDYDRAIDDSTRALALDPDYVMAYNGAAPPMPPRAITTAPSPISILRCGSIPKPPMS